MQQLEELFDEVDALLFFETDVPWLPNRGNPRPETFIADAGTDPLFARYPIRSFPAEVSLTTTVAALAARTRTGARGRRRRANRRGRGANASPRSANAGRAAIAERVAADAKRGGPITKLFLSRTLDAVREKSDIVVNEYSAQADYM